ncbi:MAG: glycosyltransferase family 4 protein [Deltaproteobacteria bacterium]|nr:glycosyltransferase family 4 protein [Deltaproteobacteria bacterium]
MGQGAVIGVVTTSFPRHAADPSGAFVLGLSLALAARGHRIEVVCPEPPEPARWAKDEAWLAGIEVFGAPYARPRRLERLFFGAGVPDNLARSPWLRALVPGAVAGLAAMAALRSRRWDAVMSHWLVPSSLVAGALSPAPERHLAVAHSSDVHLLRSLPSGRWLAVAAMARAGRVGFVSRRLLERTCELLGPRLAARMEKRFEVTPMGVDLAGLVPGRLRSVVRARMGLARFAVLALGRLVPVKGMDVLVEALAGRPGFELVVAGDGPERARLEVLCRKRGVTARFLGWVSPAERAELLHACDAVALPSRPLPDGREEGLPLTAVETLAAGRPLVASITGAIPEIVTHGTNGLLVPPDDPAALGQALETLRADPALAVRLGFAGAKTGRARSWERLADRYEALLNIQRNPGGPATKTKTGE